MTEPGSGDPDHVDARTRHERLIDQHAAIADLTKILADGPDRHTVMQVRQILARALDRDLRAEQRDQAAGRRDRAAAERLIIDPAAAADREAAAIDRYHAGKDRDSAAEDRYDLINLWSPDEGNQTERPRNDPAKPRDSREG